MQHGEVSNIILLEELQITRLLGDTVQSLILEQWDMNRWSVLNGLRMGSDFGPLRTQ